MYIIATYILSIFAVEAFLKFDFVLEEENKRKIRNISCCIATSICLLLLAYQSKSLPISGDKPTISRNDSFSQASVLSGASLLSDF